MKREVAAIAGNFRGVCPIFNRAEQEDCLISIGSLCHCGKDIRIVFVGVLMKHPEQCETSFALLKTVEQ
jgi:hypothetical protein